MTAKRTKGPRIPVNERRPIASLRRYMGEIARVSGRGEAESAQEDFASRCGTSLGYLVQISLGIRRARAEVAVRIEKASIGLVRAEEVCPDFDWHYCRLRNVLEPLPEHLVGLGRRRRRSAATVHAAFEHDQQPQPA